MWSNSLVSAIKSDLLDFVSTIQADTQNTLAKVIGEDDIDENEETVREKKILDLKRSFNTYSLPVEEDRAKEFDKFFKTFSLSTYATDIAAILDAEIDVSRFYADLVPSRLNPDDFWARYFFKLSIITRGDIATLDEYDEEDIAWETDEVATAGKDGTSLEALETMEWLKAENARLKSTIKALVARVTELEALVQNKPIDSADVSLDSITFANEIQSTALAVAEEPIVEQNLAKTFEFVAHEEIVRVPVPTSSLARTMLKEDDIALLVEELEVSRDEAEALLCANNGSVQDALAAVIADPTSLAPFAISNEVGACEENSQTETVVLEAQPLSMAKKKELTNPVISLDDEEDEEDGWEV